MARYRVSVIPKPSKPAGPEPWAVGTGVLLCAVQYELSRFVLTLGVNLGQLPRFWFFIGRAVSDMRRV